MHWAFDQAAINAYKLITVGKTWTQGHLEFRRALYTKLLVYSELVKPQLWKDLGPHNWTSRPTRQSCVWCCKVNKVRRELQTMLEGQEGAGREILKELKLPDIGRPNTSWGGCSSLCAQFPVILPNTTQIYSKMGLFSKNWKKYGIIFQN